ncbi:hypothetical protein WAI453_006544 [Rhynchosporium graminicola]
MPDFSEAFVASIAFALNKAHIPCLLWGHYLLNVHGVPSAIASIDFVVPDKSLLAAIKVLSDIDSLLPCADFKLCSTSSPSRPTPPPTFHAHIEDSEIIFCLYLQSETLWFLPPFDRSLAFPMRKALPTSFALASDQILLPPSRPGRGSGSFEPGYYPVIVPKAHILLEAFMLLYARDWKERIGDFAMAMIAYIELYVDEDGFLDTKQLPEPLLTYYKQLGTGEKPVLQWSEELTEAVCAKGYFRYMS